MFEQETDERFNLLLAEIDRLSKRVRSLEEMEIPSLPEIDSELSLISVNAVQNKKVTTAINECIKRDCTNLTQDNVDTLKTILDVQNINLSGVDRSIIIYDKDSPDGALNWGYKSGIHSQEQAIKDLSAYKRLRIFFQSWYNNPGDNAGSNNILEMDLTRINEVEPNMQTSSMGLQYTNGGGIYGSCIMGIIVHRNKTNNSFGPRFFYNGNILSSSESKYFIFKIEGIF